MTVMTFTDPRLAEVSFLFDAHGVLGTKIRWDYLGTAGSFELVTGKSVSLVAEIHSCAIGCGGLVGRIEASQDTARMCAHNGWEATSRV